MKKKAASKPAKGVQKGRTTGAADRLSASDPANVAKKTELRPRRIYPSSNPDGKNAADRGLPLNGTTTLGDLDSIVQQNKDGLLEYQLSDTDSLGNKLPPPGPAMAGYVGSEEKWTSSGKSFHIYSKSSPLSMLLPYQAAWVQDKSIFKIGCMSRQVGKDYGSAGEGISDIAEAVFRDQKKDWMIAAPSERQSLMSLDKWQEWAEAFDVAVADISESREGNSETLLKAKTIEYSNGSKVMAVPGNPDTVRGASCNVLMTEFAFFEAPDETWRAIYPSITNPLRGGLKKIRLISTPNGLGNKFADIFLNDKDNPDWSRYKVTIHQAVEDGLPVDVEKLRKGLNDPDGWAQEFECDFMDTASVLLPYDVIAGCEHAMASMSVDPNFWLGSPSVNEPLFMGVDFGRTTNLTVPWTLQRVTPSYHMTKEVLSLRNMNTVDQMNILRERVKKCLRVAVDYTGPGIGLGDMLVKEFGEYNPEKHLFGKIMLFTFTNTSKCALFPMLRNGFDKKALGIPNSRLVREDLHSVYRTVTPKGSVTYAAPHVKGMHADYCSGLALAHMISQGHGGPGWSVFVDFNQRTQAGIYVPNPHGEQEERRTRFRGRQSY